MTDQLPRQSVDQSSDPHTDQSTESPTASYGRTDGLTKNSLPTLDQSFRSVPRVRIQADYELAVEWRRYAPANTDPSDIREAINGWLDDWDDGWERQPIIRTGTREPLCWHLRSMVKRRDNWTCRWCGIGARLRELHLDHITPWSANGPHDTRNLQVLCDQCNELKGNRLDPGRRTAPGVVIECLRCRTDCPPQAPNGDLTWCFTCETFSHERTAWVDLAQQFLIQHCDQIIRPKTWTPDVAKFERWKLIHAWQDWAPQAALNYERELRATARDLALNLRDSRAQLVAAVGAVSVPPTASEPAQQQAPQRIPNNEAEVGCG